MTVQQALIFPFEIDADLESFSINYDAGGAVAQTMTKGACGSVLSALWELNDTLSTYNANLSAYINTSNRVVIVSAAASFDITWTDTALGALLGFRDNLSGASSYTATDAPKFMWLPDYHSNDLERFAHEPTFQGGMASDGTVSGISTTPDLYTRRVKWAMNDATNIYQSACETSFAFGGDTHYPEEERCLEYLVNHALTATPEGTDASGLSLKGCYWIPDLSVFEGAVPTVALSQTWTGGGVRTNLSSSPDRYTYCSIKKDGWDTPASEIDRSNLWYKVGLQLTACPDACPAWSAP